MNIFFHNTLTNQKEKFEPIKERLVKMYNCGPTVYGPQHIGNMRSYVFADILKRTLEDGGFKVKQVINITDVGHLVGDGDDGEDKIEKTAKSAGKSAKEIADFYENAFYKDLAALNIETKSIKFPRATDHIREQIDIIKILEEKGFAYQTSDGMYFDTSKFSDYGKLGQINLAGQEEGARIGTNSEKKNKSDFALWKLSKNEKRLQEWKSPWGIGFPGWHIECSAMSRKYLGQPFDIHTGGIDHVPIHHNNEIAQSVCAYGVPLANYWLHNEFLMIEGEKMSKSLGNTFTVSDLKSRKIHPLSFRYWLLMGKYNTPMNFTWESVQGAQEAFEKLLNKYLELPKIMRGKKDLTGDMDIFERSICNDLNTPVALSLLQQSMTKDQIVAMDKILGLDIQNLTKKITDIPDEIRELKKERDAARKMKNWQKSDELRKEIEKEGYVLEDQETDSNIRKKLSSLI